MAEDEGTFEERSVCIGTDPKMAEVMHFMGSHKHEGRLRNSAELEERETGPGRMHCAAAEGPPSKALRQGGTEKVDAHLKALLEERDASPPVRRRAAAERAEVRLRKIAEAGPRSEASRTVNSLDDRSSVVGTERTEAASTLSSMGNTSGSTFELTDPDVERAGRHQNRRGAIRQRLETYDKEDDRAEFLELLKKEVARKRMDRFETRMEWRDTMDAELKRLLIDMELSGSPLLSVEFCHRARCEHLDRIYAWYVQHGMKEVRKERKPAAFLKFNEEDPVRPGSLRAVRGKLPSLGASGRGLGPSSSSPALLSAGSGLLGASDGFLRPTSSASGTSMALGSAAGMPSTPAGSTLRSPMAGDAMSLGRPQSGGRQRVKRPSGSNPGGAQLGRLP